ncbi:AAA family ATPase [Butyrivibrio sp. WCD2001]|uniref:AAA family ATPase n=1 Tax=Butyrivibrio sp. WCD2001 TaxID=1280681 RepID=UPI0003F8E0E7|nr:AAA family ATPase [Butyrivibrio sp. WCD2001]
MTEKNKKNKDTNQNKSQDLKELTSNLDELIEEEMDQFIEQLNDELDEDDEEMIPAEEFYGFNPENLLTDMAKNRTVKTLFREGVIAQLMAVLISMDKPNALLVGPAGSGKTSIAEDLAHRIASKEKEVPKALYGYRICSISFSDIISGSSLMGDLERKVKAMVDYLENQENKVILFIDEVHMLFSGESYKRVSQMLKPALSRGRFKVIAATTTQEVKMLDTDPAFNRRFTRILVDELTAKQTEYIIEQAILGMEKHYGVKIRGGADVTGMIVKTADEFCSAGSHRPDNAITLLDRTIAEMVVETGKKTIKLTREQVESSAYRITSGNSKMRKLDEKRLLQSFSKVKGQQEIIDSLMRVIKLHDMHIRPRKNPLTLLFAGPSGVGKSELAKILAKEYVGEKPIVLNMAEYNSSASINRIIGAPSGYVGADSNAELPFDKLDTNPYQLILLDEFEKCDRSVQRLFMSAFDEGVMKTNVGKEIDFSKAIIIATTNAGCTRSVGSIGFCGARSDSHLTVSELSEYFDIELLNRFSHKYTFSEISRDTYADIVRDIYRAEVKNLDRDHFIMKSGSGMPAELPAEILRKLVDRTYQSRLGARPAKTAVTEYVDGILLELSSDDSKRGSRRRQNSPAYEVMPDSGTVEG